MEYIQIPTSDDFRVKQIYTSYCETFPEDERRGEQQFNSLFSRTNAKIFSVLDDLESVGYIVVWELSEFIFVEHFEVFPKYRCLGYGSQIIAHLFKNYTHIVLESEPEHLDSNAARRIKFYQKNGFGIIDELYVQPSYGEGRKPLDLWLLANWTPTNTDWIKEEVYDTVYR